MEQKPFALGYVGVGLMGLPMVQRLLKLGWRVRAYDIVPERLDASGAERCASAADTAKEAGVVLLTPVRCGETADEPPGPSSRPAAVLRIRDRRRSRPAN